jgi:hypothetical protein
MKQTVYDELKAKIKSEIPALNENISHAINKAEHDGNRAGAAERRLLKEIEIDKLYDRVKDERPELLTSFSQTGTEDFKARPLMQHRFSHIVEEVLQKTNKEANHTQKPKNTTAKPATRMDVSTRHRASVKRFIARNMPSFNRGMREALAEDKKQGIAPNIRLYRSLEISDLYANYRSKCEARRITKTFSRREFGRLFNQVRQEWRANRKSRPTISATAPTVEAQQKQRVAPKPPQAGKQSVQAAKHHAEIKSTAQSTTAKPSGPTSKKASGYHKTSVKKWIKKRLPGFSARLRSEINKIENSGYRANKYDVQACKAEVLQQMHRHYQKTCQSHGIKAPLHEREFKAVFSQARHEARAENRHARHARTSVRSQKGRFGRLSSNPHATQRRQQRLSSSRDATRPYAISARQP